MTVEEIKQRLREIKESKFGHDDEIIGLVNQVESALELIGSDFSGLADIEKLVRQMSEIIDE